MLVRDVTKEESYIQKWCFTLFGYKIVELFEFAVDKLNMNQGVEINARAISEIHNKLQKKERVKRKAHPIASQSKNGAFLKL